MLQVVNNTPFIAQMLAFPNEQGVDSAYAVIKGTWTILPAPALAKDQFPLILSDQFWGEPGLSSLKYASEATLIKPTTDVFLLGTAYPPDGESASQVDVSLRVGSLSKDVRVFGDRDWKKGILSTSFGSPQPFDRMPLVYERAFGGTDKTGKEEQQIESEPRNPVGVGFRGKKSALPLEGTKLPNLENPSQLISGPKDRPAPAGFGPIPGSWEPRRSKGGTYDEAWQKNRAPYLPGDFDMHFFNAATPDLQAPTYLVGA
jgi:hypothetical protein